MKRGIGWDLFDDDIDTGADARRARQFVVETHEQRVARERRDAQDQAELRDLYARACVWSRR